MTRLMIDGETISVQSTPKGIPINFTWQERIHRIERVRERREVDTGWWNGEEHVHRTIFAITTADGMLCTIYFDHLEDAWYLEKLYD